MPEKKSKLTLERVREISDSLRERETIERAFIFLEGDDLLQFLRRAVVAEWILGGLPRARATVAYRGDGGCRESVVACAPALAASLIAEPQAAAVMPVDWFDIGAEAPVRCDDAAWERESRAKPDLVLLPGMLSAAPCRIEGLADTPPVFCLPAGFAADAASGSESTVALDAALEASVGATLAARIETEPGGGVIPLAACDGTDPAEFKELIAAIARARLVVSADPLHLGIASAFAVPCAAVGPVDFEACLWNPGDIVLGTGRPDDIIEAVDTLMSRPPATGRHGRGRPASGRITLPLPAGTQHRLDIRD